jgi:Arc/MetJ family transcription regulator
MQPLEHRTNIVINQELLDKALKLSGLKTKRDVIHEALELMVKRKLQQQFSALYGKIEWEGNLDEMRRDDV